MEMVPGMDKMQEIWEPKGWKMQMKAMVAHSSTFELIKHVPWRTLSLHSARFRLLSLQLNPLSKRLHPMPRKVTKRQRISSDHCSPK